MQSTMKYVIEDQYGDIIGKSNSIKDARSQVELHIGNGLAEKYKQTCSTLRWCDSAMVTDITFGTYFMIIKGEAL